VIVLDSAGYGPVAIAKSVSIVAPDGVYAGVTVTSGAGVAINAAGANVLLRGLAINGQGGATGILLQQGTRLRVEKCSISNMADNGIDLRAPGSRTQVVATSIVASANTGVYADAFSGPVAVALDDVRLDGQTWGLYVRQGAIATMRNSRVSASAIGAFVVMDNAAAPSLVSWLSVDGSSFDGNATGIEALTSVGAGIARVSVERSTFAHGTYGVYAHGSTGLRSVAVSDSYFEDVTNGVRVHDAGSTGTMTGNVVANALIGFVADNGAAGYTLGDNRPHENSGGATSGNVSPAQKF
jgi:hypothetical protein